jgi:hypothetical protein
MTRFLLASCIAALVACGGNGSSKQSDAPPVGSDAPPGDGMQSDTPPGDGSSGTDAAVGVVCGATTCAPTQECCVGANGGTCVDMGTCQTVTFACDGPEDCEANQVCCFAAGGGGPGTAGAECKSAQACQTSACHTDGDCADPTPKCCPIAQTQFSICRANCQ